MKIHHTRISIMMVGGLLLLAGGTVQAQVGGGSSSGSSSGAVGLGGPEITTPGKGGDAPREGSGSTGEGFIKPSPESSGTVRPEGAIIMKPEPEKGSGRMPDSSTTNPGKRERDSGKRSGTDSDPLRIE